MATPMATSAHAISFAHRDHPCIRGPGQLSLRRAASWVSAMAIISGSGVVIWLAVGGSCLKNGFGRLSRSCLSHVASAYWTRVSHVDSDRFQKSVNIRCPSELLGTTSRRPLRTAKACRVYREVAQYIGEAIGSIRVKIDCGVLANFGDPAATSGYHRAAAAHRLQGDQRAWVVPSGRRYDHVMGSQ